MAHVDELIARRSRIQINTAPHKVIARILNQEVHQFGGLFQSRIPIMAKDIAEALELKPTKGDK